MYNKVGEDNMLDKEINEMREKLNNAILKNEDYGIIYNISIQLDELIAKYYRESKVNVVKSQQFIINLTKIHIKSCY